MVSIPTPKLPGSVSGKQLAIGAIIGVVAPVMYEAVSSKIEFLAGAAPIGGTYRNLLRWAIPLGILVWMRRPTVLVAAIVWFAVNLGSMFNEQIADLIGGVTG